jgi:hypothetical protein
MLALTTQDPDVPVLNSRLKHVQFGIGGDTAVLGDIPAAVSTAYPAGSDPNATTGNEYKHYFNTDPLVSTLERPVRFSGGTNPYGSASPTDIWLSSTTQPNFLITNPAVGRVSVRVFISGAAGDIVYAPFSSVPITEAGLVVSGQADVNVPYNQVVSYVNFNTFNMTTTKDAELEWVVEF